MKTWVDCLGQRRKMIGLSKPAELKVDNYGGRTWIIGLRFARRFGIHAVESWQPFEDWLTAGQARINTYGQSIAEGLINDDSGLLPRFNQGTGPMPVLGRVANIRHNGRDVTAELMFDAWRQSGDR